MAVTGAGLEGVVATSSQICFIDGDAGILSYQGFDIHTLADKATFEEVIYLLWHGRLPKQTELDELKAALVAARPIPRRSHCVSEKLAQSRSDGRAADRGFRCSVVRSAGAR
jgi:citrate synthase